MIIAMWKRTKVAAWPLLVPFAFALAACGGGETASSPSSVTGSPAPKGPAPSPGGRAPALGVMRDGVATYYDGDGSGACSFDADKSALDFAALNAEEWDGSAACGACADVKGPKGNVTVRIVDLCPECKAGALDLSAQAFAKIANPASGRVPITWSLVPCAVAGNVKYLFKDGSSEYWAGIQVRNHKLPIAKLEWKKAGAWSPVKREAYNYFVASGMGAAPLTIRITAWDGSTLEDVLPAIQNSAEIPGKAQF